MCRVSVDRDPRIDELASMFFEKKVPECKCIMRVSVDLDPRIDELASMFFEKQVSECTCIDDLKWSSRHEIASKMENANAAISAVPHRLLEQAQTEFMTIDACSAFILFPMFEPRFHCINGSSDIDLPWFESRTR